VAGFELSPDGEVVWPVGDSPDWPVEPDEFGAAVVVEEGWVASDGADWLLPEP
jgi:hypothetical protein